jgi:hypothetical protein
MLIANNVLMPLTVFDVKGMPGHRRERIEAAVVADGKKAACHTAAVLF